MWVEHIPRILYDEMNGYDFDLEFSGTELDYNELVLFAALWPDPVHFLPCSFCLVQLYASNYVR